MVLAPTNHPKQTQNHCNTASKKHPQNSSKTHTIVHRFWVQNEPQNEVRYRPKIDPGGTMRSHGTQRSPNGRYSPPRDPKGRSRPPLGYHFPNVGELFWMFFNIIHDLPSTVELCSHQCPVIQNESRRWRRDQRTNEQTNDQANDQTKERPHERTNERPNDRTNEQTNEQGNEGTNTGTIKWTNERTNERTKEQTYSRLPK